METSAKELFRVRSRLGWSQAKIARELGLDVKTISRWENGQTRISELLSWALRALQNKYLGITIDVRTYMPANADNAITVHAELAAAEQLVELPGRPAVVYSDPEFNVTIRIFNQP